jgi:hypothetical protein
MPGFTLADVDLCVPSAGTACEGNKLNDILKAAYDNLADLEVNVANAVLSTGGTMAGALALNFTPTQVNHAVTVGYVNFIGLKPSAIINSTPASATVVGVLYRTDSHLGSFNLLLPATPADGARWGAHDSYPGGSWQIHAVHVLRNAAGTRKIAGVAQDLDLDVGPYVGLIYNQALDDWQLEL